MFGKVFKCALLAMVILAALIRSEETVEFSAWCSCRVPMRLILLRPRPTPCDHHRRFNSSRLYLTVLLLLLAGDVELNPGPTTAIEADDIETIQTTDFDNTCDSCGMAIRPLTLRSREINTAIIQCAKDDCNKFAHDRCKDRATESVQPDWICSSCSKQPGKDEHYPNQPDPDICPVTPEPAEDPPQKPQDLQLDSLNENSSSSTVTPPPPEEPLPGPSFISVSMMDVMEAVRLTQLKVDRLTEDLDQVKQLLRALQPQDRPRPAPSTRARDSRRPEPSARHDPAASDEPPPTGPGGEEKTPGVSPGERRNECKDKQAQSQHIINHNRPVLVIGDSNVRRLQFNSDCPNVTFHSIPGATAERVKQDMSQAISACGAKEVVIHTGTNDITRDGSEVVTKKHYRFSQTRQESGGGGQGTDL